jgi:signal transduction histidine kinase
MIIRTKLTLIFFGIVILILTIVSVSIFFFSSEYRKEDFYRRLKNRAINTAKVLVEIEEVNAELLQRMEKNNPASLPNQYIVIYDYKNRILYSSERTQVIPPDTSMLNAIRLEKEVRFRYNRFEAIGFMFQEKLDRFTIIAAATDDYGISALKNLRNILVITFLISLIIALFLGWFYAGRVLHPITKIVKNVSKITAQNLDQRLDEGNKKDELSRLAATFNKMLERLQSAFSAQRDFIANASHEIKTPITVMSSEIEVSLLQDRDKEYYKNALRSVLGNLKALNKLSTQLLLLAQTSSDEPAKRFSPVRIDDVLWEMKEELIKAHPTYQVEISFAENIKHEALELLGDEQLIRVAIINLMDNGCKYSPDKKVSISLNEFNQQKIQLTFLNKGAGIPSHLIDRIFDPFYRATDNKHIRGFGIGLSLVHRIIQLHSGSITVESIPNYQTKFTLTLPLH